MNSHTKFQLHRNLTLADRLGILLSAVCAIHCLVLPFLLMSLPIMARYYLMHPKFHWYFAALILPLGGWAFWRGYRHHRRASLLWLGFAGLFLVSLMPLFLHSFLQKGAELEPLFVGLGSLLLVWAHWRNHSACGCSGSHTV